MATDNVDLPDLSNGAMVAGSKQPDAARQLINFLSSDGAATAIRKAGLEPVGKKP